jgi:hypothetical protein
MKRRTQRDSVDIADLPGSREAERVDIFDKCHGNVTRAVEAREANVYPYYRVITTPQDPVVIHGNQELIMLGSNNYLGLTNHPEVKEAAATGSSSCWAPTTTSAWPTTPR